ncbi:cell wall metabolism sensor histidine kinase WalK [Arthrobacter sp. CJ23]|uniref:sensor histidine kinase n=1 Tax=Arthrobacter sp. CJ23 TaxID=2972479 RepID=UPI00215CBBE5|nr:ATP-binding protein [Arthrobacter sp. CJ23]UVJ39671.1 ATP-binding protein [Arthrobacter sp. CJ23]
MLPRLLRLQNPLDKSQLKHSLSQPTHSLLADTALLADTVQPSRWGRFAYLCQWAIGEGFVSGGTGTHSWSMDAVKAPPHSGKVRTRRWGVRKRATATAVAFVAAALLVGGLILLLLLQRALVASTESLTRLQAETVVAHIVEHDLDEASQYLRSAVRPGQYIQILNPDGSVFAASVAATAATPITTLRPEAKQTLFQRISGLKNLFDDELYVVATGVKVEEKVYTVAVAATVRVQSETVSTVAWFMLGAAPLLLAGVGVGVWMLVGRSLRQVERIRSQVADIDARSLDGRVDVPQTSDEIRALALTMNMMLDRLQASDLEQRRFISDASHELRSPLATLSAAVEIAAADSSGATWEAMKEVLAGETARMRYLVQDLLTLARTNDDGLRLDVKDVDLDDVLNDEVRRLRSTSKHEIEALLEPARVTGDVRRLGQAVRNVLDNAERYAQSRISIQVRNSLDGVLLTIDNDGPPVPIAERERIFERFVRLDESRSRESGGSGLGLAIADAIMSAHGGRILSTATPGGGCRFELAFPGQTESPGQATPQRLNLLPRQGNPQGGRG